MRIAVKPLIGSLLFVLLLHLACTTLLKLAYPLPRVVDTGRKTETLFFLEDASHVVMVSPVLRSPRQKMVLLGSSNVSVGLRPEDFARWESTYEIHNLAISFSNVRAIKDTVDFFYQATSRHGGNLLVLGISSHLFVPDDIATGDSLIKKAQRVADVLRFEELGICRWGDRLCRFLHDGAYPYYFVQNHLWEMTQRFRSFFLTALHGQWSLALERARQSFVYDIYLPSSVDYYNRITLTNPDEYKDYWHKVYHGKPEIPPEQFQLLREVMGTILQHGDRLLIVDMPLHPWARVPSTQFSSYLSLRDSLVRDMVHNRQGDFVSMMDAASETEFWDMVHPRPSHRSRWAQRLSEAMMGIEAISAPRQNATLDAQAEPKTTTP